jgi:4-amino-4-deoxy-L-arabinose transferase-like glycosyltransferase
MTMLHRATTWVRTHPVIFCCLVVILTLGAALRFTGVGSTMHFSGDEARDAFLVRSIARDGQVQLLGAPVSIGDGEFKLGPAFLYLLVPGYLLAGESSVGGAWTVAILSFVSIFLVYLLGRRLVNERVGVIASLLYSASYTVVHYGRWQWNPNVAPFFILLLLLGVHALTVQAQKHRTAWVASIGVCAGLLFQLHATAIFIVPPLLVALFLLLRIRLRLHQYLLGIGLFLLLQVPLVLYDVQHNYANVQGFLHILQGSSTISHNLLWRIGHVSQAFSSFFAETLLQSHLAWLLAFVLLVALGLLVWQWRKSVQIHQMPIASVVLLTWLVVPYVVFYAFTGEIFLHYFTLLLPLPFFLIAIAADWSLQHRSVRSIAIPLIATFVVLSAFLTVSQLLELRSSAIRTNDQLLTLQDLQDVTANFIQQAHGRPFRVSANPEPYVRSFQYLLDQAGHPPDPKASLAFTMLVGKAAYETSYRGSQTVVRARVFPHYTIIEQEFPVLK